MTPERRAKLEAKGWKFGTVAEFLGLSPEESALVEARVTVAKLIREARVTNRASQSDIAAAINTSQARVSKTEDADKSVSLDIMFKTALAAGVSLKTIGEALAAVEVPNS